MHLVERRRHNVGPVDLAPILGVAFESTLRSRQVMAFFEVDSIVFSQIQNYRFDPIASPSVLFAVIVVLTINYQFRKS